MFTSLFISNRSNLESESLKSTKFRILIGDLIDNVSFTFIYTKKKFGGMRCVFVAYLFISLYVICYIFSICYMLSDKNHKEHSLTEHTSFQDKMSKNLI